MGKSLKNFLEQLDSNYKVNEAKYNIEEQFPLHGKRKYKLNDLKYEIEDGVIYFCDSKDTLINSTYVMGAFNIKSVKSILQEENLWTINFKSGSYIQIKVIIK